MLPCITLTSSVHLHPCSIVSNSLWPHWRRQWQPTPVLLPGKSHGQRSLVGYSPLGREGHDWVTSLSLSTFMHWRRKWQLQCSCLENPRDGEASWAAVYGVAQSQTRLKRLSSLLSQNHCCFSDSSTDSFMHPFLQPINIYSAPTIPQTLFNILEMSDE